MPIIKDVPGVGRVEFADEAAALKFEQSAFGGGAGGPFEQTLGQRAERAFDVGREAITEFAGPAILSTTAPGQAVTAPEVGEDISAAARFLAPESIPELAGEAALTLASGGTAIPGQVARRFAQRTLIPPAVTFGTAQLTGTESPAGAAAKTAIGTFVPEIAGGAKRGVQNILKRFVGHKGIRQVAIGCANAPAVR